MPEYWLSHAKLVQELFDLLIPEVYSLQYCDKYPSMLDPIVVLDSINDEVYSFNGFTKIKTKKIEFMNQILHTMKEQYPLTHSDYMLCHSDYPYHVYASDIESTKQCRSSSSSDQLNIQVDVWISPRTANITNTNANTNANTTHGILNDGDNNRKFASFNTLLVLDNNNKNEINNLFFYIYRSKCYEMLMRLKLYIKSIYNISETQCMSYSPFDKPNNFDKCKTIDSSNCSTATTTNGFYLNDIITCFRQLNQCATTVTTATPAITRCCY